MICTMLGACELHDLCGWIAVWVPRVQWWWYMLLLQVA
jgi:hypothetical protein